MTATDELRKEAHGFGRYVYTTPQADCLTAIADRIDREHRTALEKVAADAFIDGAPTEAQLEELGWVKLPVDADGVPIRVGDVLNPPAGCDDYMPLQVVRLTYDGYENEWFFDGEAGGFCGLVGEHMDVAGWTHHHAPTVEDVLREFGDWYAHVKGGCDEDGIVAEYAAKLRLAREVDA